MDHDSDFVPERNKYLSMRIRKKFKRDRHYICCGKPESGNYNKEFIRYCCTYPMVYKRYNQKLYNKFESMNYELDI